MRYSKILIPVLALTTFFACSSLFNKGHDGLEFNIQTTQAASQKTIFNGDTLVFRPLERSKFPDKYPPFTSQVNDQQIIINGYYYTSSGFTPAGSFKKEGNTLTIRLHQAELDDEAPSEPRGYFYNVYITNLSKGDYNIKIIHENDYLLAQKDEDHTVFSEGFIIK